MEAIMLSAASLTLNHSIVSRYLDETVEDDDNGFEWRTATDAPTSTVPTYLNYTTNSTSTGYIFSYFVKTSSESDLRKANDVSVDSVLTSIYFNTAVFVLLMIFYECLRRTIPSVYSSRKRMNHMQPINESSSSESNYNPLKAAYSNDYNDTDDNNNGAMNSFDYRSAPSDVSKHSGYSVNVEGDIRKSCTRLKNEHLHKLKDDSTILPDSRPLDWIKPVLGVPWSKVLLSAGLDGYFFLRYIRMCVRITAVSSFWFFLILVPIYATGSSSSGSSSTGWYHLSTENIPKDGWRMWLACIFAYLFAFFIFFVIRQEYRHYLEIRQDFLARGSAHVHPQHHYSLLVENIPYELRSDRALADYFNKLFPGKVHSASVVLKLPDLEKTSARCLRSCRRLEKSIALLHESGKRPTHVVGRARLSVMGIDLMPVDCTVDKVLFCGARFSDYDTDDDDDDDVYDKLKHTEEYSLNHSGHIKQNGKDGSPIMISERPKRGTRVDSISYYTYELSMHSRALFRMQQRKTEIAECGNTSMRAQNWFDSVVRDAEVFANTVLDESAIDNALVTVTDTRTIDAAGDIAERMTSKYGSITNVSKRNLLAGSDNDHKNNGNNLSSRDMGMGQTDTVRNVADTAGLTSTVPTTPASRPDYDQSVFPTMSSVSSSTPREKKFTSRDPFDYVMDEPVNETMNFQAPFGSDQYKTAIRRVLGRLGLDFLIAIAKFLHGQIDFALEGVLAETMSSTGIVTFLDLSSVACANAAPLTVKASVLDVAIAPEPREIIWENAHVSKKTQISREHISNIVLFFGAALWTFPLTFIQAVAKADVIAQLPGMEWILTYNGGSVSHFVNGYLPVIALLGLITILPVIFEYIAVKYEHRKTLSDVQASMLGRYFNYQLVNIYVSVTAGSILLTITNIADHPISIVKALDTLPRMAGYFVALLVTKILAGLPMIFLRFGALMRMLFLKLLSNEKKLTQREVDAVYRLENVQYGWEFPTQLLVVVIVFTYAIVCPIILPVGMIYFIGALTVYKKQILYVYSPVYESGGAMFPLAVQKTLFGLVCSQITFLAYIVSKGCYHQPWFFAPLPILTVITSNYFRKTYAEPSKVLSLERARAFDRFSDTIEQTKITTNNNTNEIPESSSKSEQQILDYGIENRRIKFDKMFYRQPVLTEVFREPWTYRRGIRDEETIRVREELRRTNRYITQMQMVRSIEAIQSTTSSKKATANTAVASVLEKIRSLQQQPKEQQQHNNNGPISV